MSTHDRDRLTERILHISDALGGSQPELGRWEGAVRELCAQIYQAGRESTAEHRGPARPRIVCLCGSTRFGNFFHIANLKQTLAGEIVLSIGCDTKSDADLAAVGALGADLDKAGLDELHKRKIDLADYVLVISDEAGYFGESTWSEIKYAWAHGKPVEFAEPAAEARALALPEGMFT
jgi:hypothetical protein